MSEGAYSIQPQKPKWWLIVKKEVGQVGIELLTIGCTGEKRGARSITHRTRRP